MPSNESSLAGLDNEQQKVVEQKSGLWLLTGDPGTGKTTLLIRWVTSLIASRAANPQEVLVLTCTQRAIMEMRERFLLQLGEQATRIALFTFSTFSLSLLQEKHPEICGLYGTTQREQLLGMLCPQLHSQIVRELAGQLVAAFHALAAGLATTQSKPVVKQELQPDIQPAFNDRQASAMTMTSSQPVRNSHSEPVTKPHLKQFLMPALTEEALYAWLECKEPALLNQDEKFIELRDMYLEACQQTGVIDREYLPVKLGRMLEKDKRFLSQLQSRFRYLALDEFQELSSSDYILLNYLCRGLISPATAGIPQYYKGALLAGDPKQSLNLPVDAAATLWPALIKDYAGQTICCSHNYRSAPAITAAGRELAAQLAVPLLPETAQLAQPEGETHWPQSVQPVQPARPVEKIKIFHAKNELEEIRFVITMIEELARDFRSATSPVGSSQGSYAYPQLAVLFRHSEFGEQALPYFESAGIPVAYHTGPRHLTMFPFKPITALFRLLVNPQDLAALKEVLDALLTGFKKQPASAGMLLDYINSKENLLAYLNLCRDAGRLSENTLLEIEELIGFLGLLRTTCESLDLAAGLQLVFDKYIKISDDDSEKKLIKAALLESATWFRRDIKGFVRYLGVQAQEYDGSASPWGVNLLTFAAAKGREYPVVFIIGAEEGITPVTTAASDMEEERHLFYIALTRAREKLFISTAARREVAGQTLKLLPSRFLSLLPAAFTDTLLVQKKKPKLLYEQLPLF